MQQQAAILLLLRQSHTREISFIRILLQERYRFVRQVKTALPFSDASDFDGFDFFVCGDFFIFGRKHQ